MKKRAQPATEPVWAPQPMPSYPELRAGIAVDVCIVGAGIAGLTTAYLLSRKGLRVAVLDDGPIASGQSFCTSAHLSSAIDDRYVEIERLHGRQGAELAAESHSAAIDRIETIVLEEDIDCDFRRVDGYLFSPPGENADLLDREFEAMLRTGKIEVERLERAPWTHFDTGRCLRIGRQGQFHPLKYLLGLAEAIRRHGGQIFCGTHVSSIEGGPDVRVTTRKGQEVLAKHIVVATNTPINDLLALHTKQAPYTTYVIGARVPHGTVPSGLYWDTADPYHYVRLQRDDTSALHDILIVGGEDHKTGQAHDGDERFARLEQWARQRFPFMDKVDYHWSGQCMETVDGLAFIGLNPMDGDNAYVVTGDSGMGLTHGTIAGQLITELIMGQPSRWAKLYSPSRKPLGALARFASENLNVASQYGTWLTPGEVSSPEEVEPGCGAIMRSGLSKVALYRDGQGQLTKLSAVCPHLKCIVTWNDVASTWDCPCHGSIFDCQGKVVNGPANVNLERLD